MRPGIRYSLLIVGLLIVACKRDSSRAAESKSSAQSAPASGGVVDSALPMDVLLERFRKDVPKPDGLHSDIKSRDELVKRIVNAMASNDTATLARLAVNRAEYAWLYFPTTKVARPPYEAPPAFAWFQVQQKNERGGLRAMRELGGHRVELRSYKCDDQPTIEGENRVWTNCRVTISRDGQAPVTLRLFGSILERGGRFEVITYDNDF